MRRTEGGWSGGGGRLDLQQPRVVVDPGDDDRQCWVVVAEAQTAIPTFMTRRWWRADDGQVSAFVVVVITAVLALAGLTLDGGLALGAKVRATGQAEAAARAGAQAIDLTAYRLHGTLRLVPAQALARARAHLAAERAIGTVTVSGDTVTVTVTTSQPTQLLGLVGIGTLEVHGRGSAHPQRGVTAEEPATADPGAGLAGG